MSRLGLPANECLENLQVPPYRELDTRINENSHANKNCSIPPLQYSLLPSRACRSVPKRDKETMTRSPWLRGGIAKRVNDSWGLGLGLGLDIKTMANVESKQTVEGWQSRHRRCEEIDRAGMIDLNFQSPEQLLESSMADSHNSSLPSDPAKGLPCYSMTSIVTEGRMREEKIGEYIENGCYLKANCYISEDDNVRRKSACSNKQNYLEKPPVLHAETVKTQPTRNEDVTNNSWIGIKTKTSQALEKLRHFTGDEIPEDQRQELRDSAEDLQATLSLSQHTAQMDEPPQPLPSHLQTLQLDSDKSVPSTDSSIGISFLQETLFNPS